MEPKKATAVVVSAKDAKKVVLGGGKKDAKPLSAEEEKQRILREVEVLIVTMTRSFFDSTLADPILFQYSGV